MRYDEQIVSFNNEDPENIFKLEDIKDDVVAISINGDEKVSLMKEGDKKTVDGSKSNYNGTYEVVEIEKDFVRISADLKHKLDFWNVFPPSAMFTMIILLTLAQLHSRRARPNGF